MAKISLAGFKDPVRRPRYIIWTLVVVLVIAGVMVPVLGVTSTRWFCAEGCHKVQDDTIIAYEHSSHSKISCMACHMPVNANPVVFLLHKAEALGELAMTVTNNYELPLNAESEVALTMKERQCTQCHNLQTRTITTSPGIKIDHNKHTEKEVNCTICHNRIAHNEDFKLTLTDPKTGEPNKKHANFMKMTPCFRCHGLEEKAPAPGTCSACHPEGFDLKPANHDAAGFLPKGHAEMASEAASEVAKTLEEYGIKPVTGESKAEAMKAEGEEPLGERIPPVGAIFYCGTCHKQDFCIGCHGTPMPHSKEFLEPKNADDPAGHPAVSKQIPDKCVMCHTSVDPNFCNNCHHGEKIGWEYKADQPWTNQHPQAVAKSGVKSCTEKCHTVQFCSDCHTKGKVVPQSHKQANWTRPAAPTMTQYGSQPATPSAQHALSAQQSMESCEVCHGAGGTNAAFCMNCHKLEMPHTAEFKQFHAKTGRDNPKVCENCHTWPQLCSNCHHVGSSTSKPWIQVHGQSVSTNGAAGCVEKCHKQTDCVACHQKRKVVPASHKSKQFIKLPGAEIGLHAQYYKKDNTTCTYCHPGDPATLPNSAFCKGCHNLDMPHATGFGKKDPAGPATKANAGAHASLITSGQATTAQCLRCHESQMCNACHHAGSVPNQPWVRYHPNVVKQTGANACFECHQETYCSNCHVNLAKRGLLN